MPLLPFKPVTLDHIAVRIDLFAMNLISSFPAHMEALKCVQIYTNQIFVRYMLDDLVPQCPAGNTRPMWDGRRDSLIPTHPVQDVALVATTQ